MREKEPRKDVGFEKNEPLFFSPLEYVSKERKEIQQWHSQSTQTFRQLLLKEV